MPVWRKNGGGLCCRTMNRKHSQPRRKSRIESHAQHACLVQPLESRTLLAFSGLPIQLGGSGPDFGQRIAATSDGGFVAGGIFSGTVDFDPGAGVTALTSKGETDVYIAKYDSAGALQWVKQIGGTARLSDLVHDDRIDIAAKPERTGGPFINGVGDDPKGEGELLNDIEVAADGSILVTGEFLGSMTLATAGGTKTFKTFDTDFYDAMVLRIDTNGQILWAKQFGDRFTDTANAITEDASGNLFVTGLFTRTVSFVPGNKAFTLTAKGRADGYVMKLTSAGAVQWVNAFGGGATDQVVRDVGNDVAVDSAGNVYVAGEFGGTADFDPGAGVFRIEAQDDTDGVLVKYSPAGRFRAALPFSGKAFDALTQVAVDSSNNVFVAGYFQGKRFDANPGAGVLLLGATPTKAGRDPTYTDSFVEKLSGSGVNWVKQIGGKKVEFISDMKLNSAGDVVVGGSFYDSVTFGSGTPIASTIGTRDFKDKNDGDRNGFSYDAYVWQISGSTGATIFTKTFGGTLDDFGSGLALASDDSIILTGRFGTTVDFDTGSGTSLLTALGLTDAFIAGFDSSGAPIV